jgi:hypothetical protein
VGRHSALAQQAVSRTQVVSATLAQRASVRSSLCPRCLDIIVAYVKNTLHAIETSDNLDEDEGDIVGKVD